jgi:phospholipid/cholesterol/gamma-HCH transport system substrate-binding protein
MENKSHALAAGIFTIVLAIGVLVAAMWLNRDTTVRVRYVLTTNGSVAGLNPQAAVKYRGMDVGKVEKIEFDRDKPGQINVTVGISPETPITNATFAELGMQGLTGLAYIQFDADRAVKDIKRLTPPAQIVIRPSLFDRLSSSGGDLVEKAGVAMTQINKLLDDDKQKLLTQTLVNLQGVSVKVGELTDEFKPVARSVTGLAADGRKTLKGADDTLSSVSKLAQDINKKLDAIDKANVSLTQVGNAAQAMETQTLPRLNTLLESSDRSARTIDRAVDKFSDEPTSVIFGPQPGLPGPGEPGFAAPAAGGKK